MHKSTTLIIQEFLTSFFIYHNHQITPNQILISACIHIKHIIHIIHIIHLMHIIHTIHIFNLIHIIHIIYIFQLIHKIHIFAAGIMKLLPISSQNQLAYFFTKSLLPQPFNSPLFKLGLVDIYKAPT